MTPDAWWTLLAAIIMVVGLCGVIIPILPGLLLIWITAFVYGFIVGFTPVGIGVMMVLTVLVAISVIKGFVIPKQTATASGASGWSQVGGLVGAIIGFFLIPVIGVLVGALVGVLLVEILLKGNWDEAWTATKGTAKGFGISAVVDLGLGMVMLAAWSVWASTVVF